MVAAVPVAAAVADRPRVLLYTDGACSGNPGPGGWSYVLRHPESGTVREKAGADPHTTNNQMELRAVIEGLVAIKRPATVELYSDSKYVLEGLKTWMAAWKRNGWKTSAKKPVKNAELWRELDALMGRHTVTFHWVRGHASNPDNNRCDQMAVAAREALAAADPLAP